MANSIISKFWNKLRFVKHLLKLETEFEPFYKEDKILDDILKCVDRENSFIIEIGASNGTHSNTYELYRRGACGVAIEPDSYKFTLFTYLYKNFNLQLCKTFATPRNIITLLVSVNTPENPMLLNIDIDGYDYYVLFKILKYFRPVVICAEINEAFTPPYNFRVCYDPNIEPFHLRDLFFGMSISAVNELAIKFHYDIVDLACNNVFLIDHKKNVFPKLTPEVAYNRSYERKKDQNLKYYWGEEFMLKLSKLDTEEGLRFIHSKFAKYKGKYVLKIEEG